MIAGGGHRVCRCYGLRRLPRMLPGPAGRRELDSGTRAPLLVGAALGALGMGAEGGSASNIADLIDDFENHPEEWTLVSRFEDRR